MFKKPVHVKLKGADRHALRVYVLNNSASAPVFNSSSDISFASGPSPRWWKRCKSTAIRTAAVWAGFTRDSLSARNFSDKKMEEIPMPNLSIPLLAVSPKPRPIFERGARRRSEGFHSHKLSRWIVVQRRIIAWSRRISWLTVKMPFCSNKPIPSNLELKKESRITLRYCYILLKNEWWVFAFELRVAIALYLHRHASEECEVGCTAFIQRIDASPNSCVRNMPFPDTPEGSLMPFLFYFIPFSK